MGAWDAMSVEPTRLQVVSVDGRPAHCHVLDALPPSASPTPLSLPLLFLHGLGCSSDAWRPALQILARRRVSCPVFVPDLPGFGCSPGPHEVLGMEDLADWAARLLDVLGVAQVHVAGNSMGCQVALALARRHPERVGGLILVGPTVGEQYVPAWRYALGLLVDGTREPLVYNALLARMYAQQGIPHYLATTRKMLEDEPLKHADEVRAPCLVLRGARDGIIPDAVARRLAAALPRGEFRRLEGAPHALNYGRAAEFVAISLEFFLTLGSGTGALPSRSQ